MRGFLLHSWEPANPYGGAVAATWFETPALSSRALQRVPAKTDLLRLPPSTLNFLRLAHDVLQIRRSRMISICPGRGSHFDRTNFLDRPLRTEILFSDKKNQLLNKLERMRQ
jgi:hypothetical protein